jgi:hypothetical protein
MEQEGNDASNMSAPLLERQPGKVIINSVRMEFGFSLVWGYLYGSFLKSRGWDVTLTSRMKMPEDVQKQCCNRYIYTTRELREDGYEYINDGRTALSYTPPTGDLFPLKWSTCKPIVDSPHVCVIFSMLNSDIGRDRQMARVEWQHTMPRTHWQTVCDFIRSKGYKIVGYGSNERCSREIIESISDIPCFYDRRLDQSNEFLEKQLDVMAGAKTTVAIGGASFITMVFDLPGVSIDGNFQRAYCPFFSRLMEHHTSQLFWTSNQDRASRADGYDFDKSKEKFHEWMLNRMLQHIERALR